VIEQRQADAAPLIAGIARLRVIDLPHMETVHSKGVMGQVWPMITKIAPIGRVPDAVGRPCRPVIAAKLELGDVQVAVESEHRAGSQVLDPPDGLILRALTADGQVINVPLSHHTIGYLRHDLSLIQHFSQPLPSFFLGIEIRGRPVAARRFVLKPVEVCSIPESALETRQSRPPSPEIFSTRLHPFSRHV
jgi:hypothetical protein